MMKDVVGWRKSEGENSENELRRCEEKWEEKAPVGREGRDEGFQKQLDHSSFIIFFFNFFLVIKEKFEGRLFSIKLNCFKKLI